MCPKDIKNSTLIEANRPELAKVSDLKDKIIYEPNTNQVKLKSMFWSRYQPSPLLSSVDKITLETAINITGNSTISKWWHLSGFKEWFLNKDEERERLKYLFNKSLDTIEQLLDDPTANANAKMNIFKTLAEITGHSTKKTIEKFSDEAINKMSEQQLKLFLKQKGVVIEDAGELLDVKPTDQDSSGSK